MTDKYKVAEKNSIAAVSLQAAEIIAVEQEFSRLDNVKIFVVSIFVTLNIEVYIKILYM
jgi:hypothetical protein